MEEKIAKLPNAEVHYWQGEFKKKRETLLMVHGFRGDHNGLRFVTEYLFEDFNVVVPDLPGFGASSEFKKGKHDLENYVETLRDFIVALKLEKPPVIASHSFGTIVTSSLAAKSPELMDDRFILICPIAVQATTGALKKVVDAVTAIGYKLPDKLGKKITGSRLVADVISLKMTKVADSGLKARIKHEHRTYFGGFSSNKSMLEGLKVSNSCYVGMFAPEIAKNTLIIATEKDDITSVEKQKALKKQFKNANLTVINGTGHIINYEKPKELAGVIRDFVNKG